MNEEERLGYDNIITQSFFFLYSILYFLSFNVRLPEYTVDLVIGYLLQMHKDESASESGLAWISIKLHINNRQMHTYGLLEFWVTM